MSQDYSARPNLALRAAVLALMCSAATPLAAQNDSTPTTQFDGLAEIRGVISDIDMNQGEEIDSSGFGARIRLGAEFLPSSKTEIRIEGEARIFEFRDDDRDSLETLIARLSISHEVTDELTLMAYARRYENIAVLEAFSADQTSLGGRVQWQSGNDRVRVDAEYREREYDTTTPGDGNGYRVSAQYNRRLGSYQWVRFNLRHEEMQSDNAPRRSYDRQVASIKYSHPIGKRLRLRPSLEYRQWDYDTRIALGDPEGDLRKDSYVAPGIELAYGRDSRGLYGVADVEYRIRTSNDERYESDAIRVGVRVGYRF